MLSRYTNTFFPICSFVISLLIVCIYYGKNKVQNEETNIYSKLVLVGLIESGFYVILTLLVDFLFIPKLYFMFRILNKILGTIYIIWMALLLFYTIKVSFIDESKINKSKIYIWFFSIISSTIVILLPIKLWMDPVLYQSNSYGPSIDFLYVAVSFYIGAMLIIVIKNRKNANLKSKYIPLYLLFALLTISLVLRTIDPLFNVTSNILSLVLLVMYHTIENPDVKLLKEIEMAKDQADKANRAKTDFLSSMSHEIRTPLNAIVGFSDYIISSETLEEAKENAKDIVNASQTLLEIVNGILDISKIEAGKLEIVNSKYAARNTFESLAKLITPKMNEKGLDFSYYIAPDLPETLFGDHANIKKIITNLLSNAYKYTDKGSVRYEVNCINSQSITKLIITVEDTGRGIKKDKIDKLFTKFQRLEEDKNTTIEGTGLGLAITKQLTELMGGKILVHTVYGEGSKFTVVLNQRIESSPVIENKQELSTTLDLTNKKILIVDDNLLNIKVAIKILQRYNANDITSVNNGIECLEKIESGEIYDLILLDDMMPKMTGPETLEKLKEMPDFNQPVVILTANAITGMKEKYLSQGFDEYLSKPIEKEELIRVCNKIFSQNSKKQPEEKSEEIEQLEITEELEIIDEENSPKINLKGHETYLRENGVDLDKSLEFLGDIEMYNMTISDFLADIETKWQNIIEYKKNNDMTNYAIEVHSLKSDAKYLGFTQLANVSYEHELKSKENNSEFIYEHFEELEKQYQKALEIAKNYSEMIN